MTKPPNRKLNSPENMAKVLDQLAYVNPSFNKCMSVVNGKPSSKLVFEWMLKSSSDQERGTALAQSEWCVEWFGQKRWFHEAVLKARSLFSIDASSVAMSLLDGIPEVVIVDGLVQHEEDLVLLARYGGRSAEACARAAADKVFDYPYKHEPATDEHGDQILDEIENPLLQRIPLMRVTQIPAATRKHILEAILPGIWNIPNRIEANVKTVSRVMHLGEKTMARTPTPMVQDLEQKLAELRARGGAENPHPRGHVEIARPSDTHPDDTGPGAPPPQANPRAYQQPLLPAPKAAGAATPPYAKDYNAGTGREGIGPGPDPRIINGAKGVKMVR